MPITRGSHRREIAENMRQLTSQLFLVVTQFVTFALCSLALLFCVYLLGENGSEVLIYLAIAPVFFISLVLTVIVGEVLDRILQVSPSRALSKADEIPDDGIRRIVDIFARAFVTDDGHVVWSPPQVWPIDRGDNQLVHKVQRDMEKRKMIWPCVVREQSEAVVTPRRDDRFLRATCQERFRVVNRSTERGVYFISNEQYFRVPSLTATDKLLGYGEESEEQPFNWSCTRIKIVREGGEPLEFRTTDNQMIEHLWHRKNYWSFDYPVTLDPEQSANIEIDVLTWIEIEELGSRSDLKRLPLMNIYRNFIPKGTFIYDVVEEPHVAVRVQDVLPEPRLEDYTKEKKKTPQGADCWHLVFPRIIMQRLMGITMFLRLE